jgi:hypothetical protein
MFSSLETSQAKLTSDRLFRWGTGATSVGRPSEIGPATALDELGKSPLLAGDTLSSLKSSHVGRVGVGATSEVAWQFRGLTEWLTLGSGISNFSAGMRIFQEHALSQKFLGQLEEHCPRRL